MTAAPLPAHPAPEAAAPARDTLDLRVRVDRGDFLLNVDVHLPSRGITAIFGASGCGKTTLLRAVAGLERAAQGRIVVAGTVWQDGATWLPPHRRAVGMVFQDAALFPHLSVQANLDFGRKRVPPTQRRVALEQAIDLLGIAHLRQRQPARLSGGERQRVAIARALATSPRLLLMDEPLASLDAPRKAELLPYFGRIARALAIPVLYVTHAFDEVAQLADHVLVLEDGTVRAEGAVTDILATPTFALHAGDAAAVVVQGVLAGHDARTHLTSLRFSGGTIQCVAPSPEPARPLGEAMRVRIRARDVSLARSRAEDSSILNILPATIVELRPSDAARVLVVLDLHGSRLLAHITRASAERLALAPGQPIYAQIKGVAVLD